MSHYIVSQVHLGSFLLTHSEQHCSRQTDTHEFDVFCARGRLTCRIIGHILHDEQYLFDRRVIMRVSRLQRVFVTL